MCNYYFTHQVAKAKRQQNNLSVFRVEQSPAQQSTTQGGGSLLQNVKLESYINHCLWLEFERIEDRSHVHHFNSRRLIH